MAAFDAARELCYLRELLSDLGEPQTAPTILYEDNQACIRISEAVCNSDRTKHIDARYHMLRERVLDGSLKLVYVNTKDMIADTFTKALLLVSFRRFRDAMLGISPLPVPKPDNGQSSSKALSAVRPPGRTNDHAPGVLVTGRDAHASTCDHAGWE